MKHFGNYLILNIYITFGAEITVYMMFTYILYHILKIIPFFINK